MVQQLSRKAEGKSSLGTFLGKLKICYLNAPKIKIILLPKDWLLIAISVSEYSNQ
jgi:hypothetical protein